jgi:hypothetical protein
MAPLNPSEWVAPRVKKGTDPPGTDLHVTHIRILTLRRNMRLGQSQRRKIGVILPLKKLFKFFLILFWSSQKAIQALSKMIRFLILFRSILIYSGPLDLFRKT